MRVRASLAAIAVAAALSAPAAAAADEDCDPEVERALVENAKRGAEDDLVIVRHPDAGIRDPDSIFDFSCVTDMFNYRHSQILFDPGRAVSDILGLLKRQICAVAREAYGGYLGRGLDDSLFGRNIPRLPGLRADREAGNLLDEIPRLSSRPPAPRVPRPSGADLPAPGVTSAGRPAPARPSGADLFRDLIGGGSNE